MLCSTCQLDLPTNNFHRDKTFARGYKYSCRDCLNKTNREYYKQYSENNPRYWYGRATTTNKLTNEEFTKLIKKKLNVL